MSGDRERAEMTATTTNPKVFRVQQGESVENHEIADRVKAFRTENPGVGVVIEYPGYRRGVRGEIDHLLQVVDDDSGIHELPSGISFEPYEVYESAHWIPACQIPKLTKEIARLNRKGSKVGSGFINMQDTGETEERVVKEITQHRSQGGKTVKIYHTFHEIIITGRKPKFEGWTFVATLEYLGGETIIKSVPGQEIPKKYRKADNYCDHCKARRRRKETFVVHHEEKGEYKQVGRQCIRDFLGGHDPHRVGDLCSWYAEFETKYGTLDDEEVEKISSPDSGYDASISLLQLLTYTSAEIRKNGWLSRTAARNNEYAGGYCRSTADRALSALFWTPRPKDNTPPLEPDEQDEKEAAAAIAWAAEIDDEVIDKASSDYLHNIRAVARVEGVHYKQVGIGASIIVAYQKDQEREIQRRKRNTEFADRKVSSTHFGEIKKRYELELTLERLRYTEGNWGTTVIHGFVDENGNEFVWFASGEPPYPEQGKWGPVRRGLIVGETYKLRGTVKAHNEWKDIKQTVLSRCNLEQVTKKIEEAESNENDNA